MTKRDVAIWFCKVVALSQMMLAVFNLASDVFGWRAPLGGSVLRFGFCVGLYLFVWLFSAGIGTELAAQHENAAPLQSSQELRVLLWRCAGLWLFLSGSLWLGKALLDIGITHFFGNNPSALARAYAPNLIGGFVESAFGFLLAFGPRIRAVFRFGS